MNKSNLKFYINKENELELFKFLFLQEREKVVDLEILINDLKEKIFELEKD